MSDKFRQLILSKKDIANMIRGAHVPHEIMDNTLLSESGRYHGGFNDHWSWNYNFESDKSIDDLLKIYNVIKQSYKELT